MIAEKKDLILRALEEGTGASICAAIDKEGLRSGLRIWFGDIEEGYGPTAELRPYGLRGHQVNLTFGKKAGMVVDQISRASPEDVQLARALVSSIGADFEVEVSGQSLAEWRVTSGSFRISAKARNRDLANDDNSVLETCRNVIVPIMAAMAELIGYDILEEDTTDAPPAYEGAISNSLVRKRERNPRNRLLCIRIHGEVCVVCNVRPRVVYGDAGSIIEVHHLEPLSLLATPRQYDPRTDLVPLCPNCHRAIHTRRPRPFDVTELRDLIEVGGRELP